MPQGGAAPTAFGDWVSATTALNTYYSYFIEVTPGTPALFVDIFDADMGAGLPGESFAGRDFPRGGNNTGVFYSLIDPTGAVFAAAFLGPGGCGPCDNAWATFAALPVINPLAGHWELRIDLSRGTIAGNGNDVNAIGVRAYDGDPTAGGREIDVYYDSYASYGVPDAPAIHVYTDHPYVTSGCIADANDFDWDSGGSLNLASPFGLSNQTFTPLSGNNAWQNNVLAPWATDSDASGYGVWTATVTITGGINFGDLYYGSFAAANPAPTAQPEANTFRVYLPTDGGGTPSKPWVEQIVRHVSGPNPPQAGMTSRVEVRVRVNNPTPYAITFSTPTNLVTTTVPGGNAVYAGGASVNQGTIVAQPAIGAGGTASWNPGTLASGQRGELVYRVDATPAVAGQRVPVTGTPASGGTTARYLDETANAAQARATYLFGPLCELAVVEGLTTHAVVEGFSAFEREGEVVVEWRTASEAGTLGFRLLRLDPATGEFETVGEDFLPGLLHEPQGGTYRFVDPGAPPGEPSTWALVEIEAEGGENPHGPWTVVPEPAPEGLPGEPQLESSNYARLPRALEAQAKARPPIEAERPIPIARRPAWVIGAEDEGWVRLGVDDLAALSGQSAGRLRAWILRRGLRLTTGGEPVAYLPIEGGHALRFYARAPSGPFARQRLYRLGLGLAEIVESLDAAPPPGALPEPGTFVEHRDEEVDRFAATALGLDPRSDYWFWQVMSGGHPTLGSTQLGFDAPGRVVGEARLTLRLQGATDTGVVGEHHVEAELNGVFLGEVSWQGVAAREVSFELPAGVLEEAGNTLRLTALRGAGVSFTVVYVDGFELRYPRRLEAVSGELAFDDPGGGALTVGSLAGPGVELWEISEPDRPRRLEGFVLSEEGGEYRLSFTPPTPGGRYLLAQAPVTRAPELLRLDRGFELLGLDGGAEHLIIAPAGLTAEAERLASHRRGQGLVSEVLSLDAVLDSEAAAGFDPDLVRSFLARAHLEWPVPPRWVLLVGAGTYDYLDHLGLGGNLLPPRMVETRRGLFASDASLGDVVGDDGIPEIAIGRVPIANASDFAAWIDKVIAYDSATEPSWSEEVFFLADGPAGAIDFGAESDRLAAYLPPGRVPERAYLASTSPAAARGQLIAALARGLGHLHYAGHGGADRLDHGLLLTADVPALGNSDHLPLVTALTCTIGRFEIPGFEVLGEALVRQDDGGAIAVWAPSGVSVHGEAQILGQKFFEAVYRGGAETLGEAVLTALQSYGAQGGDREILEIYQLLGDPAQRLLSPSGTTPGPTNPDE